MDWLGYVTHLKQRDKKPSHENNIPVSNTRVTILPPWHVPPASCGGESPQN